MEGPGYTPRSPPGPPHTQIDIMPHTCLNINHVCGIYNYNVCGGGGGGGGGEGVLMVELGSFSSGNCEFCFSQIS